MHNLIVASFYIRSDIHNQRYKSLFCTLQQHQQRSTAEKCSSSERVPRRESNRTRRSTVALDAPLESTCFCLCPLRSTRFRSLTRIPSLSFPSEYLLLRSLTLIRPLPRYFTWFTIVSTHTALHSTLHSSLLLLLLAFTHLFILKCILLYFLFHCFHYCFQFCIKKHLYEAFSLKFYLI